VTARFYMVIVLAVLLIGRTYIRPKKSAPTEWVYPSVPTSLAAAHLLPLQTYLDRRRVKFREYARKRDIYKRCAASSSIAQPFPTLWDQLTNTPIDERNPELNFGV
jgi:hypothetical protein